MKTETLGLLKRVDLREVFSSEAGNFTPWLAQEENLKLLGETIGIDLQCEAQEKDVGPFRADILRKYGYPPDKQEKATQTVLEQAELLCKDWAA
jgi:Domain of unknown function (DUF3387)